MSGSEDVLVLEVAIVCERHYSFGFTLLRASLKARF